MQLEEIVAEAQRATGLSDMGDPAAMDALRRLVAATNAEARLSEAGAPRWQGSLVKMLGNRLRVVDYVKQHPELLERPIEKPMFVFGLPRTGTTLTINLLNADPGRRCYLRWEGQDPIPPAKAGQLSSDPRYFAEQDKLAMSVKYMPHIAAIHYEDADSPTECQFAMALSFSAQLFESQVNIPSFRDWFLSADYTPAFRFQKQLLQMLQAENSGRWTLKNPWHPLFLDALTSVYPDAQLVMTHRDPVEVVGSACSLIRHIRPIYSDTVDLPEIAAQMIDTFDVMIARQNAFRDTHGERSIFDIQYADQLRDPIGVMRKLYAHFDEPLTAEAEVAMTTLLRDQPKGKHGKHEYSLEEFGLTKAYIRDHYRDYYERYGVVEAA